MTNPVRLRFSVFSIIFIFLCEKIVTDWNSLLDLVFFAYI